MRITQYRFNSSSIATQSILFVDGEFCCYILENAHQDEKIPKETRVPAGTYDLGLRTEGGFHNRYLNKFPDMHEGMVELLDVPNFKYILVHIGNSAEDTDGCLLTGSSAPAYSHVENLTVKESKRAYQKFYKRVIGALVDGEDVKITIHDEDKFL